MLNIMLLIPSPTTVLQAASLLKYTPYLLFISCKYIDFNIF